MCATTSKIDLASARRVLQGVLDAAAEGEQLARLAGGTAFQEALLTCAVELVTFAWHADEAPFPAATMQLARLHRWVTISQLLAACA